jgi:seryl-tRNA synthetase
MKQKVDLEKEKKAMDESAAEKDVALKKKVSTIGNIVHESVPVNNNEVRLCTKAISARPNASLGFQRSAANMGPRRS